MRDRKHTEESRQKMSESLIGRVFTQEHRDKIASKHQGTTRSLRAKINMAAARSGYGWVKERQPLSKKQRAEMTLPVIWVGRGAEYAQES